MSLHQEPKPVQDASHYRHLTLDELDRCARRAEHFMNRGLERRLWEAVRVHRCAMLAVESERRRRLGTVDGHARHLATRQVW